MKNSLTIAVILLIAAGCSKQEERTSPAVNPAVPAADSVVVSVNGAKLTRSELSSYVEMMVELQNSGGQKLSPEQMSAMKQELESTFPETWIHNLLMAEYAKKEGLSVTEKQLKRFRNKAVRGFAKNYDAAMKRLGAKYRETVLGLGGGKSALEVFRDFRGREPAIDALLRQQDLKRL